MERFGSLNAEDKEGTETVTCLYGALYLSVVGEPQFPHGRSHRRGQQRHRVMLGHPQLPRERWRPNYEWPMADDCLLSISLSVPEPLG